MSKQALRAETERLVREAMEKRSITIKEGASRIEAVCGKCGARNRVTLPKGEIRAPFACKDCGHKQKTL
jgi:transcription elongation factor Elf1